MAEVAAAFVTLVPSFKGGEAAIAQQLDGPATAAGKSSGGKFSGAFSSVLKKTAAGIGVAAGGLIGTALVKGFQRLESIDDATASLRGLGHSGKEITTIMDNALASVRGTAFGLGDAATVAASAVAAGIKPGKQLESNLKLVADAATIAKVPIGEMGAVFNKVATSNKIQGDVIAQLNDKGIPIVQLLGKEMGKTAEQVTQLASDGKIDFATFSKAMQAGLGGAALQSGNTFSGALANIGASLSRIGAGLLGGVFPHLAPAFQGITTALGPLEDKSKVAGAAIGKFLGPALEKIGPFITKAIAAISGFDFSSLTSGSSQIGQAFQRIGNSLAGIDFSSFRSAFGKGISDTVSVFSVVISFLADHVDLLAKALPALIVAFAAYKVAQAASNVVGLASLPIQAANVIALYLSAAANNRLATQMAITSGVENLTLVTRLRTTAATIAGAGAALVASAATKVMTAGQWLLNAALSANPIGLVIIALVALGAGLYLLWTKSETFRGIVTNAFNAVVSAAKTGFEWVKSNWPLLLAILTGPFGLAVLAIVKNWTAIKAGASAAKDWIVAKFNALVTFFQGLPEKIKGIFSGIWAGVAGGLKDAINSVLHLPLTYPAITVKGVQILGGGTLIPALASGGVVTKPTLALIGEAGPEAVVPLSGSNGKRAAASGWHGSSDGLTRADLDYLANRIATLMGLATDNAIYDQAAFAGTMGRMHR